MPNIKSAKKRVKVSRVKKARNTSRKSDLKTAIKKAEESILNNDENKVDIYKNAIKTIDKAAAKNIIHKNTAARKKSRLTKALSKAV